MVGATVDLGYMALEAQQTFRTERVFAGIFVIGLIDAAIDLGFRCLCPIAVADGYLRHLTRPSSFKCRLWVEPSGSIIGGANGRNGGAP